MSSFLPQSPAASPATGLADTAPVIILMLDPQGAIQYVNHYFERLTGWRLPEIQGRDWFDTFLPARDHRRIRALFQTALSGVATRGNVNPILTRAGEEREIEWNDQTIRDADGRVVSLLAVGSDVTERQQREDALRASEERHRLLVENSPQCIHELDQEGRFLSINPAGLRMFRQPDVSRVIGRPYLDAVSAGDRPRIAALLDAARQGRQSTFEFTGADGRIYSSNFVPLANGRIMGISADITAERLQAAALARSEESFRALFEQAAVGMAAADLNGNLLRVNRRLSELLGYAPEEIQALGVPALTHPDDLEKDRELFARLVAGELPYYHLEKRYLCKGGGVIWGQLTVTARREQGRITEVVAVIQDITQRKQAEEELRETRDRLEATLQALPDLLFEVDDSGRILDYRAQETAWLIMAPEQFLGQAYGDVLPRDAAAAVTAAIREASEQGIGRGWPYRLALADGEHWFELSAARKRGADGAASYILLARNTTARVRAEQEVRDSERRLQNILDSMFAFVGLFTPDGMVIEVNRAPLAAAGLRREDVVGRPFWDAFWWSHSPEVREQMRTTLRRAAAGEIIRGDFAVRVSGDKLLTVDATFSPLYDQTGRVTQVVGSGVDVTERKRAEDALRIKDAAIAGALNGIAIADAEGVVTYVNRSFLRLLGYDSAAEVLGRPAASFWENPEDVARAIAEMRVAGAWTGEVSAARKDGSPVVFDVSANTVCDDTGAIVALMASFVDTTDRKRTEQQAQELRDALAHAARLGTMGELASGLAHELNQPLAALSLYSSAAQQVAGSGDLAGVQDLLQRINEQALRAGAIVRRMRSFIGRGASQRGPADLNELIREVLQILENDLRHNVVALDLRLAERLPPVFVDGIQIQQVLVNLIRNAVEAMADSDRQGRRLTIRTELVEREVRVCITDAGNGLSPKIAATLFHPFQTTKAAGLGLGLAICRTLIQAHGGGIGAEANLTGGATFYFTLPVLAQPASA